MLPINPAARQLRHVMRHLAERHGLTVTFNMIKVYRTHREAHALEGTPLHKVRAIIRERAA